MKCSSSQQNGSQGDLNYRKLQAGKLPVQEQHYLARSLLSINIDYSEMRLKEFGTIPWVGLSEIGWDQRYSY